jgi:hypothetical protein
VDVVGSYDTLRIQHFLVVELVETLASSFFCFQAESTSRPGGSQRKPVGSSSINNQTIFVMDVSMRQ